MMVAMKFSGAEDGAKGTVGVVCFGKIIYAFFDFSWC